MNLSTMLAARARVSPVRVALIGAGKFGSMFLSQVPTIPGLEVAVIADRDPDRARNACLSVGWDQADRGMEGTSGELFAASKNAVMGFSRSLAVSLAPHVRVNCLAPGWIRTAWGERAGEVWQERVRKETPLGRWGTPEDVARLARFLASDDADFITGQVIRINGGAVR